VVRLRDNLEVLAVDDIVVVHQPLAGGFHLVPDLSQRAVKYTLAKAAVDRSFGWA
jgi:hypothetical protein